MLDTISDFIDRMDFINGLIVAAMLIILALMMIPPILELTQHGSSQLEQVTKGKPVSNEPAPEDAIEQIHKGQLMLDQVLEQQM